MSYLAIELGAICSRFINGTFPKIFSFHSFLHTFGPIWPCDRLSAQTRLCYDYFPSNRNIILLTQSFTSFVYIQQYCHSVSEEIETKEVVIFLIFEAKFYNFHHGSFQSSDEQEVGQTRSGFWDWRILGFNSCVDEKGCHRRIQEISTFETG